jgi:hypothetical protein
MPRSIFIAGGIDLRQRPRPRRPPDFALASVSFRQAGGAILPSERPFACARPGDRRPPFSRRGRIYAWH